MCIFIFRYKICHLCHIALLSESGLNYEKLSLFELSEHCCYIFRFFFLVLSALLLCGAPRIPHEATPHLQSKNRPQSRDDQQFLKVRGAHTVGMLTCWSLSL